MKLEITGEYLKIPVKKSGEIQRLRIYDGEQLVWEFRMPVEAEATEHYPVDFYAVLPTAKYLGRELKLEVNAPECFADALVQSKDWEDTNALRPGIHFTPVSGWMNDPNGLYYQNGQYHLYFQYNPFHVEWENMCWGHAVSRDLLHWRQMDSVMFPDQDGVIFSGCAVLNERGLADVPKDVPLFFYTCTGGRSDWAADKKVVQKMAYSLDDGQTLIKVEKPVLDFIVEENRDPKIYWHEECQHYYMVLYLTGNEFAVFISHDLKDWEMTQRFAAGKCNECPDLRQIPCGNGDKKWVFWTADGFYSICEFDGKCITEFGEIQEAYLTRYSYAAQTYVGVDDRVISMAWLRPENNGENFTGYQSLPRELGIEKTDGSHTLCQRPVREYFEQRKEVSLDTVVAQEEVLTAELLAESGSRVEAALAGILCCYDRESGVCMIGEQKLQFSGQPAGVQVIIDGKIAEVTDLEYRQLGVLPLSEKRETGIVTAKKGENVRFFVNS